jgi:hypothetical protein
VTRTVTRTVDLSWVRRLIDTGTRRPGKHRPAWTAFNQASRQGGEVGVWHEAYRVRPDDFETVYNKCRHFGPRAGHDCPGSHRHRETASGRRQTIV